ncbi:MAG: pilin glycosylation ligase domain-containing protein, partial [Mucilaginibacter sp.]|nr:pilin glycosylation ligase domain-containing protein [Mucilaginibacter sp.]
MRISLSHAYAWLLGLAIILPLFSFVRYAPLADWYFTSIALLFVAACLVLNILRQASFSLPSINIFILLFAVVQAVSQGVVIIPTLLLLLLFFLFCGLHVNVIDANRRTLITILAQLIFVGALVQSIFGFAQVIDLAKIFNGWVIYDVNNRMGNIFGNTGQRNHFADFLGWGIVAGSYLYAVRKMRLWIFVLSIFLLVLLIGWCGSRMPLGYALVLCALAWFWLRRMRHDNEVGRMVVALVIAVILLSIVQILGHQLNVMLNAVGLPIHLQSGSERILDASMGARRRVEWTKAIDIFLEHPLLGVGL